MVDEPDLSAPLGLSEHHLLNLAVFEIRRIAPSVVAVTENVFYQDELLPRLVGLSSIRVPPLPRLAIQALLWIGETPGEVTLNFQNLCKKLKPGSKVVALAHGRFLGERQQGSGHGILLHLPDSHSLIRKFQQEGITLTAIRGVEGPVSVLWGIAERHALRINRPDLADRCALMKQDSLEIHSRFHRFSKYILLTGEKKKRRKEPRVEEIGTGEE